MIATPRSRAAAVAILALATIAAAQDTRHDVRPPQGYVPDAATAIKIAVAVWEPIYGYDIIAGESPYQATLDKDKWIVTGSLPKGDDVVGGVAIIEIAKQDGRILRVSHGQ